MDASAPKCECFSAVLRVWCSSMWWQCAWKPDWLQSIGGRAAELLCLQRSVSWGPAATKTTLPTPLKGELFKSWSSPLSWRRKGVRPRHMERS